MFDFLTHNGSRQQQPSPRFRPHVEGLEERMVLDATNADFVDGLYAAALHRDGDAAGVQGWVNALNAGSLNKTQVAQGIITSPEGLQVAVNDSYVNILGRDADPGGLQAHVNLLKGGGTIQQVQTSLLASDEYFQLFGVSNNTQWVKAVYSQVLAREAEQGGLNAHLNLLTAGASRSAVAAGIVNSKEAAQQIVFKSYSDFLDRTADAGGLAAWSAQVIAGVRVETVRAGIAGSTEFFNAG